MCFLLEKYIFLMFKLKFINIIFKLLIKFFINLIILKFSNLVFYFVLNLLIWFLYFVLNLLIWFIILFCYKFMNLVEIYFASCIKIRFKLINVIKIFRMILKLMYFCITI